MENALAPRIAPAARPAPANALAGLYFDPRYSDVASNPTPQFDPTMRGARDYALDPRSVGNQIVMNMATSAAPVDVRGGARAVQGVRAFHGSPHRFDRFDLSRAGTTTDAGELGRAVYFTTDSATGMNPPFAGPGTKWPNRYEVNLRVQNPLEIEMTNWSQNKRHIVTDALNLPRTASAEEIAAAAQARGHDSVRLDYSPVQYRVQEWAVFDDNLIDILRRYGLLGMLGGGAAAASGGEAEAAQ